MHVNDYTFDHVHDFLTGLILAFLCFDLPLPPHAHTHTKMSYVYDKIHIYCE